eukprot:gene20811-27645_t
MYSASRTEGLPEGWEYAYDSSSGAWYYFNSVKGITQWTPPEGAGPDVTATQAADGSHPSKAANGGVGDDQQPTAAPGHQRSSSPSAAAAATERPCGISSPSSAHGLDGYYYRDPFSVLQGPFTAQQLYMWRSSLPMDLPVWYVDEGGIKMLQGGGGRHGTFPPVIEGMAATGGEEQEGEGMQDSRGGGAGTAVMKSNNADAAETCEEGPSSHMQQEGSGGHDTHPTGIEGMTAIGEVDEEAEGAFVSTLGDAGAATTIPMEADSAAIGGESAGMQGDASKVEDEEDNATAKIGAGAAAIGGESAGSQGDASKVEDEEDNATAKMGAGAAAIGGESADVPAAISDAPASISDAPASISDALAAISDVPAAEIAALDGPSAIASTKEAQLVSVPAPQPQSAAEPGSYAEAVLAGLPPTDEAVIMAQLAHAQGKTLEELVSFSYEHGGRNSRRQHDAPPATSTLVRNPYSGRLSMQVDEGLSQSATLYKDFGNWVDPDTLEDSLREAAKRKGQQLPASTWKKLKERRLEVKKKMRTM